MITEHTLLEEIAKRFVYFTIWFSLEFIVFFRNSFIPQTTSSWFIFIWNAVLINTLDKDLTSFKRQVKYSFVEIWSCIVFYLKSFTRNYMKLYSDIWLIFSQMLKLPNLISCVMTCYNLRNWNIHLIKFQQDTN